MSKIVNKKLSRLYGFTLIEIILVTVILFIIAGVALPNFAPTYLQFQLKDSANNLSYLMRYAQSRAAIEQRDYQLEFGRDFESYWITRELEVSTGSQGNFERISGRLGKTYDFPQDIEVESEYQIIKFNNNGRIDKARIYLCHKENCMTVSSQEQSGYVDVFDFKLEDEENEDT